VCLLVLFGAALPSEAVQIHVDRNVTAHDQLLHSDRAAAEGKVAQAGAVLADLLERHAADLVLAEPGLYVPVASAARRSVSRWPAAAVQQLVRMLEALAAEQFESIAETPDIVVASRFAARYFLTSAGAEAAERTARLAIEAGQIDLARFWLAELLQFHPERQRHASTWRRLQSACLRLSGREGPGSTAVQAVPGSSTIAASGSSASKPAAAESPADVPAGLKGLFAPRIWQADLGDLDHLAILWQADLAGERGQPMPSRSHRPPWQPVPVFAAELDAVLVQWQGACWAFDRSTGSLLWRYRPLPVRQAMRAGLSGPTAPRRPAAAKGNVYLVTDVPLPQAQPGPLQAAEALVCLDGRTGKPLWIRTAGNLSDRTVPAMLDGTPIVVGERVLLAARTLRTGGYHDIDLLGIDAETGRLVARRRLFATARGGYVPPERIAPIRLVARGGIVYVICAAGAAAAVDANSLEPLWIRVLSEESSAAEPDLPEPQGDQAIKPLWAGEPLLLDDSLIVPTEGGLHVLNAFDGRSIGHAALEGNVIALAADQPPAKQIMAIASKTAHVFDVQEVSVARKIGPGELASGVGGMCPLGGGRFLISQPDRLVLAQTDGSMRACRIEALPAGIPAVQEDRVYVASAGTLLCLGDAQKALARLKANMEASDRPMLAVRLAELALRIGKTALAVKALQEAVERAGGYENVVGTETGNRLFKTCITFGTDFTRRAGAQSLQVADRLLQIAQMCASGPDQHIRGRAALAQLRLAQGKPAEAVAAWQSLITDASLRAHAMPAELAAGKEAIPAGRWAGTRITEAIRRYGREIYGAFDRRAADLLEAGARLGDRGRLEKLLRNYPNSRYKSAAQLGIGKIELDGGRPEAALAPLRQAALQAEPGSSVQLQAMLHLAEAYDRLGSAEAAATWIGRLAKTAPAFEFDFAGKRWTAGAYADYLASRLQEPAQRIYSLHPPVRPAYCRKFQDSVGLIRCRALPQAGGLDDAALVWSAGSLQAVQSRTGDPLWAQPVRFRTRPLWLYGQKERLILADRYRVTAIEPATGKTLWQWARSSKDPDAPDVDPESLPTISAARYATGRIFVITADGQAACLEAAAGDVIWQRSLVPAYGGRLVASADLLAYRCTLDGKVAYAILDAGTGRTIRVWQAPGDVPAESVQLLPAATLMLLSTKTVQAVDAYTGTSFWRLAAAYRFRPAATLHEATALYAADGIATINKIDTISGATLWRSRLPRGLGSAVRTFRTTGRTWLVAERGAAVWEDATGRLLGTAALPPGLPRRSAIRDARPCSAGVLCLATAPGPRPPKAASASLLLFSYRDDRVSVSRIATIDLPAGTVSDWDLRDEAVLITSGDTLLGVLGQQTKPK